MTWLASIATGVATALIVVWLTGLLNQVLPSPAWTWFALQDAIRGIPQREADSFRIVLSWLENDVGGRDTANVEDAFSGIEGLELVRSRHIVAASGAADQWRPSMQQSALSVIEKSNADIALVGVVKKPGEIVSLWFVPRWGKGTLDRGDKPYKLEDMTLGPDFHDDLRAQLTAMAWSALAPLADTDTIRARIVDKGLRDATERLSYLLDAPTIGASDRRAALYLALGNALSTLGKREGGSERLERAADAYRAALATYTRDAAPLNWAAVQDNLAVVLSTLGDRESGTARLEQAVDAHRAALQVFTRETKPRDWAAAQDNLGNTLARLAERETGTERLSQAIRAYRAALQEHTRERVPLRWAATQNNIGTALTLLGERQGDTDLLEEAADACRAALEERPRERVPLDWAATQNNLGIALAALGARQHGPEQLEQAVHAYRAALEERTRERVPLDWAATQNNLGNALLALGKQRNRAELLEQAADAHRSALKERTPRARTPPMGHVTQQSRQGSLRPGRADGKQGSFRAGRPRLSHRLGSTRHRRSAAPPRHGAE